jgi:glycosyltransferase involved in cell wall biosynthesis
VVDNASTDETKKVVLEEFFSTPNLHYIYEPVLGISQARNTGWKNANGTYVSYIDDDAVASSYWLEKMVANFRDSKYNFGCVCGRILPIWESPRPSWFSQNMEAYLGLFGPADKPLLISKAPLCNSAYPRTLLEEIGGFDTSVSARGRSLIRGYGEDDLLFGEIKKRGRVCLFRPDIVVLHHVPKFRLNKKYFIRWAFGSGVAQALIYKRLESPDPLKCLKRTFLIIKSILSPKRVLNLLFRSNSSVGFSRQCALAMDIGKVAGFLGIIK